MRRHTGIGSKRRRNIALEAIGIRSDFPMGRDLADFFGGIRSRWERPLPPGKPLSAIRAGRCRMLSYILRIMQEFERAQGRRPQVIYLNPRHMRELAHECPDLFNERRPVPLGFRVVVLSEKELPHPKAVWLPPRATKKRGSTRQKKSAATSHSGSGRNARYKK
jgi:hypothetical protein